MEFVPTKIPDVILIKPKVFVDKRGFFMEIWQRQKFAKVGIDDEFVQENHSRSETNVLRGLHYQLKRPQGKLVRVTRGAVFDVAVDLRRKSPTFGNWVGEYLSELNKQSLWIPPGFAHGFYVMEGPADIEYKCTDYYVPEYERFLRWNDLDVGVVWPFSSEGTPVLSEKDSRGLPLKVAETFE